MGLITPQNPLVFPGGAPGVDLDHIAFAGAPGVLKFSGVAIGGQATFQRLDNPAKGTVVGAPTSVMDGVIGPSLVCPTSSTTSGVKYTANLNTTITQGITLAAIVRWPAPGSDYSIIVGTGTTSNAGNNWFGKITSGATVAAAIGNSLTGSGFSLTAGDPYLILLSAVGLTGVITVNIAAVDLLTGKIFAEAHSLNLGATVVTSPAQVYVGNYEGAAHPFNNSLAAVAVIHSALSLAALTQWCRDPWGFWYPQAMRRAIFSALKGPSTQTFNQAASWTTASALSVTKQVGKQAPISSTSSLSAAKQVGKQAPISSTSSLSAAKQVGKAASWTTASAVSVLNGSIFSRAIGIATSSALTVGKAVSKAASWTTSSAVSVLHGDVFAHLVSIASSSALSMVKQPGKVVKISSHGTLKVVKAVARTVKWTTHGALKVTKAVARTIKWTTHGALKVIKAVARTIKWTTRSAVAVLAAKARQLTVAISTSSAVTMTRQVGKIVPALTQSGVRLVNQVQKILLITTTSEIFPGAIKVKAIITVAITTVSSISITNAVSITLSWITAGVVSLPRTLTATLAWVTTSAPQLSLSVGKQVAIAGASAVDVAWTLTREVLVLISTAGSVLLTAFPIRPVLIRITTSSLVTVTATAFKFGRWILRLVGAGSRMVLYGHADVLDLDAHVNVLELNGMSIVQNGVFHLGETWAIRGIARDELGNLLDLTGATVQMRITSATAIALDLATPTNGSIDTPATNGAYRFDITPTQQAALTLSSYDYEVRVELADGTISVQNTGEIVIKPSKFVNFP